MRRSTAKLLLVLSPALLGGCVGGSKEDGEKAKQALKAYVKDAPPADIGSKLDINFDNKLILLGAKTEPAGPVRPGQKVKLTMYWKANKAIGQKGWKLFTHILDASGERILNIDNVGPLRRIRGDTQAMAPSAWQTGKVYVDEQQFTVPKKVKTATIQVVVGIWKGDDRLPIVSGPHDRQNRGRVATLRTRPQRQDTSRSTRVPQVRVNKLEAGKTIKIDGKLDDEAWKTAASTRRFVDVRTGRPNSKFPVNATAKLLWDEKALYIGFDVQDPDVVGGFDENEKDPHLWTKDTVEIMIDPEGDGDNKDYYEIQINPQNLVFDSRFDDYNQPKKGPDGPFGHQDWSAKLESAVTIDGTLDKSEDKDKGYVVEAKIPWKSFDKAKQVPPELGETWRMNFYAMQNNGGVAWSAILGQGNFHRASRFGKVLWAERGWRPTPKKPEKPGDDKAGANDKKGATDQPAKAGKTPAIATKKSGAKPAGTVTAPPKAPKPADKK